MALNLVPDIGSVRLGKLLELFGSPENIFKASRHELEKVFGIGEKISGCIASFKKKDIDKEFALAKKHCAKIVGLGEADYPESLLNIPGSPIVLYVRGRLLPQDELAIAIVGSRRATIYGMSCADRFGFDLSQKGFTVVSGLARGIDSCAHRGALKGRGRTIAVIGSGLARIYPEENSGLAEEIAQNGAVVSEFPMNTEPLRQNFPRRNRLISGLSQGVLVVEAARNSGALITADFALEQGREVFALPGKVDSATSFGTNGLIKQGAKLVSCADDIIEEFFVPETKERGSGPAAEEAAQPELVEDESRVYNLLSGQSVQMDELAEKACLEIPVLSDILLRLRLKKIVKELPGKQFVRSPA